MSLFSLVIEHRQVLSVGGLPNTAAMEIHDTVVVLASASTLSSDILNKWAVQH